VTSSRPPAVQVEFNRTAHALELLYLLVVKELKVRYKSSVLGYVWALANPFAFAFVYWFAFKYVMRVQVENYSLYLITGMFPWVWLSSSVVHASHSFEGNAFLVKKVRFPQAILPLSNVAHELVHFLFALPVILAFLWYAGEIGPKASWMWQIPLMLATQMAFAYPLAYTFAITNVYVRDIGHLAGIGFTLLFFVTPMVYTIDMVPISWRPWFAFSPLHLLIDGWRSVFLHGRLDLLDVATLLGWSSAFAAAAALIYRKLGPRLGELL